MRAEILEEIGLTKSEIKVYLALLELGSSTTGRIVDKSGASSSKIYEILDKLIQKGLVSFIIRSGVKYFETAPPSRMMDYLQEKEKDLKKKEAELKELLPQLELKRSLAGIGSETQVFKGMKGAATAFDDILKTMKKGEEYYVLGISKFTPHFERFIVNFHKKRAKQGVKCKVIVNELARDIGKKLEPIRHTRTKYVQKELFSPFVFIIYKDKTLISIGLEEVFVQIKSDNLANGLRNYFDFIWEQDTTVSKGFDALDQSLTAMLDYLGPGNKYDVLGAAFGIKGTEEKYSSFFREYHNKRIKKGIGARLLFQQGTSKKIKEGGEAYTYNANVKYLPYETDSPVATFLAKDKTLMLIQEKEPTIITINNKKVTDSLRRNFDIIWNQETKVERGIDAVQNLFEEMLEAGHCDFIGARGYFVDCRPKYIDEWEKRAVKRGFTMRNIVDPETKGHRITKFPFAETKYTLQKEFATLSCFWIYGNKIVISNWMEKEPTVIMIENKNLQRTYKEQFDVLWSKEMDTYKGPESIKTAFQNLVDELNPGEEVHIMGVYDFGEDFLPLALFFQDIRSKKGIKAKFLMNQGAKKIAEKFSKYPPIETRFMPEDVFTPAIFLIYNDKVIVNLAKEQTFFMIKSKSAAMAFESYFQMMWETAKP